MEDVEEHRRVLRDLVSASGDISVLARQLAGFQGWDVEPLVTLSGPEIVSILERYLRGELSGDEIGIWADALEVRDDVEYGDDTENHVLTAIFQLANKGMGACPVTPQEARRLIVELRLHEAADDPEAAWAAYEAAKHKSQARRRSRHR